MEQSKKASVAKPKRHPGSSPSNRISRNLLKRAVTASNARSENGATLQQVTNFLASELGGTVCKSAVKLCLTNAVKSAMMTKLGGRYAMKHATAGKSGRTRRLGRKVKVLKSGAKSGTRRSSRRKSSGGKRRKSAKRSSKKRKGKKARRV